MKQTTRYAALFIKQYRKKLNLTQAQFGAKFGKAEKTVAQWEQQKADIPLDILIRLRNDSGVPLDKILGLTPIENITPSSSLIRNWIQEYQTNDAVTFEYDTRDTSAKNRLQTKQRQEIENFLSGDPFLFIIDEDQKKIILNDSHELVKIGIIKFFLGKGLMSYEKTHEKIDGLYPCKFYISPILANAIINNHIHKIFQKFINAEQIEAMVQNEGFDYETANNIAQTKNKALIDETKPLLEMTKIIDSFNN